jgi:hypothetical protein
VVAWLFSGGGESEVKGLILLLRKLFPSCNFERKTPIRHRPGSRPSTSRAGYGRTSQSLAAEITSRLRSALARGSCDLLIVFDDLDCRSEAVERQRFNDAIDAAQAELPISKCIGFAAPELESWIIAMWNESVARHPDFRMRHERMRHWLSTQKNVFFDSPESFGTFDQSKNSCLDKLSDAIIESTTIHDADRELPRYSKAEHTPDLLQCMDTTVVNIVKSKCPLFRQFYHALCAFVES